MALRYDKVFTKLRPRFTRISGKDFQDFSITFAKKRDQIYDFVQVENATLLAEYLGATTYFRTFIGAEDALKLSMIFHEFLPKIFSLQVVQVFSTSCLFPRFPRWVLTFVIKSSFNNNNI